MQRKTILPSARAARLIAGLAIVNAILWLIAWRAGQQYARLLGLALIAYGFGLRHAVDPDHISAIDNATRRMMAAGRRPTSVGLFFSLGHSTIVVLLCMGLALSARYVQARLPGWTSLGATVGVAISTTFLFVIGGINLAVLVGLIARHRRARAAGGAEAAGREGASPDTGDDWLGGGFLTRLLRPVLRLATRSWQMYLVGLLFGLGFDTATEVGILALSAQSGQSGMPFVVVMLLPLLFTAGMCLIDTLDGILMLGAYGWAFVAPRRKLLYNVVITSLSVVVAFVVGTSELLQSFAPASVLAARLGLLIQTVNRDYSGAAIALLFAAVWAIAVLMQRAGARERATDAA